VKLTRASWLQLLLIPVSASAQIPEKFTNLKVLRVDIDRRALIETMRGFSFGLGVRCEYCHAGAGGPDLEDMDFASDEKETKRVARRMLRMVGAINGEHLTDIGREHTLSVQCFTCHRGVARPESLEALVGRELETSGIDAAISRYRELRKEYYGSSSYDFGETSLNRLGERVLGAGKTKEAVAVLELNAEFHADSAWLLQLLGEAYLASGDRDKARRSFERALALFPENERLRKKLEELKKQ
jgi:hypothetical protein